MALPHNFCPTFGEHFNLPPLTSATTGVMLLKRRQPDVPATALNQFCSIRTSNGVYTELGIDPYLQEFRSMEHFKRELLDYLDYYNNRRIKAKLKGLPPAIHRQQALSAA